MRSSPTCLRTSSRSVADQRLRRFAPFVVMVAVVAIATVVLLSMGRHLWCTCGSPVPWAWDVWSKHNSQHVVDPYAFTHMLHGVAFYAILWLVAGNRVPVIWRGTMAAALESAWEILENSPIIIERYRAATISLDYFGDSVINSIADVGACLFGASSSLGWLGPGSASKASTPKSTDFPPPLPFPPFSTWPADSVKPRSMRFLAISSPISRPIRSISITSMD